MLIAWILGALIVGAIGSDRKIGFWGAFFASILLSPLIGLLITLFSETKSSLAFKKKQIKLLEKRNAKESKPVRSKEEQLRELVDLRSKDLITEEEYNTERKNIIKQ